MHSEPGRWLWTSSLGELAGRRSRAMRRELEAWARQFGQIARWGIEGSASWGRHTAMFLTGRGHHVRDVCANRTPRSDRARRGGNRPALLRARYSAQVRVAGPPSSDASIRSKAAAPSCSPKIRASMLAPLAAAPTAEASCGSPTRAFLQTAQDARERSTSSGTRAATPSTRYARPARFTVRPACCATGATCDRGMVGPRRAGRDRRRLQRRELPRLRPHHQLTDHGPARPRRHRLLRGRPHALVRAEPVARIRDSWTRPMISRDGQQTNPRLGAHLPSRHEQHLRVADAVPRLDDRGSVGAPV